MDQGNGAIKTKEEAQAIVTEKSKQHAAWDALSAEEQERTQDQ